MRRLLLTIGLFALAIDVSAQDSPATRAIEIQKQLLKNADAANKAGHREEAISTYQAIIDHPIDGDSDIRAEAIRAQLEAGYRPEPGFLPVALREFERVPLWIWIASGVAFVLATWGAVVRLIPRSGTRIAFEELSADRETRLNNSRVLTGLMVELLTPKQLSEGEFSMDIMPRTDEPGFSGVMPALEAEVSTGYEAAEHPVKIASVEFVPREVITLFGWLRRPTKECIEGWLECKAGEATISANYWCRRTFSKSLRKHWLVRHVGQQARDEVLSLLAAQIVVDLGKVDFTRNGRSYRALRAAMRTSILDQEKSAPTQAPIPSTREHLEMALSCDPKNWIARFSLALELCKSGFPREAVEHFEMLEKLITKVLESRGSALKSGRRMPGAEGRVCPRDAEAFEALYKHLGKYPACPYLVRYNKAIALAAYDEPSASKDAHDILDKLAALPTPREGSRPRPGSNADVTLTHKAVLELRINALSAKANMIVAEAWRRGGFTPQESSEVAYLLDRVENICLSEQNEHWRSFQTARAVAHAAHGRALLASRDGRGAISALRTALAAQPTFPGAHLQIAEAYLTFQESLGTDWASRAKDELLLASRIANNCKQIQSSLAALYSSKAVEKIPEAERIYRKLGELPSSSLWLGRFILDTKARECPALFAVHQYLSACSGVSPACRKQMEGSVADLGGRNLGSSSTVEDFPKLIGAAQKLLDEVQTAGVALPPKLLATARQQLGRIGGFRAAAL